MDLAAEATSHRQLREEFFFFQAEDGIRDYKVTGVQTCALPISDRDSAGARAPGRASHPRPRARSAGARAGAARAARAARATPPNAPGGAPAGAPLVRPSRATR